MTSAAPMMGDATTPPTPPPRHRHHETALTPGDSARYDARFASRAAGIVSSVMRDLMSLSERPDIISLAGGFPNTEAFAREVFDELMDAVARDHLASSLQYGPTEGMGELRERIVDVMAHEGARARVEDIMVTSGGQQAIDLSIRTFVNPGDTVLAEGPTYPGAVPCFTTYEAQVEHVPMDDDGLRIDLVEEALDRLAAEGRPPKLLYTIPSFQNPGGVTMSLERRERLIALAHQRELLIVEDNPYGQIRFEGEALPTLWELDDGAGWVIYLSTFSKILAPGLRAGWVAAPAAVLRKMNLGKQAADLASSTVSQRFVVEYLRRHDWREYVGRLNGIYRLRRDAMLRALEEEMPPEARWTRPTGGLFVWATLPEYLDTTNLLASAVERHQVAFVPGRGAFLDGRGGHSMRLNFSGVPEAVISEGVRRLGVAVAEMTELHRALGGAEG
ncbi:MAG TPA: PLP-dependent aminotransferase family protein [Miltoncostaeaceae bacterium]|nr:PLP-dependent aminotransferase family protein [Miltoncostaeaceae bacterium]